MAKDSSMCKKVIDAIIFDMDGVLFDTEYLSSFIWKELFESQNILFKQEFIDSIKGRNLMDSSILFKKFYPGISQDFAYLKSIKNEMLNKEIDKNGLPIKFGAIQLLKYLKEKSYKVGLASSSPRTIVEKYLKISDFFKYFDCVVCGDEIAHSKPDPQIFQIACQKLNSTNSKSLVVEDSYNGVLAATRGDFHCVYIPDTLFFETPINVIKKENLLEIIPFLETINGQKA